MHVGFLFSAGVAVSVALLLAAESRGARFPRTLFKLAASTAFLGAALAWGCLDSAYGRFIFAALLLSWAGDAFLLSSTPRWFQAGLVSFLLAHFAFAAAFLNRGFNPYGIVAVLAVFAPLVLLVVCWLWPHLPSGMRLPVLAYIAVITSMAALAGGTWGTPGCGTVLAGAILFYVSDLSVARDRFVAPGFVNALWGLPLYYGAQVLLAYTVAQ